MAEIVISEKTFQANIKNIRNMRTIDFILTFAVSVFCLSEVLSFSPHNFKNYFRSCRASPLCAYNTQGRSSPRFGKERSKRQERIGHLVRTELSQIIHSGVIKGSLDFLDDELRQRISIVSVDVAPDLKQARISVSVRKGVENTPVVDRRRAYSWLVQNTKDIRHTLAQRMSHLKSTPNLTFVQVDVSAAVDVMYLIDKISTGAKRTSIGTYGGDDDSMPRGMVEGMDFDDFDFDDGDDWVLDEEEDE
jgi:ribosome-binding factor A